jgi:hypothetical protein
MSQEESNQERSRKLYPQSYRIHDKLAEWGCHGHDNDSIRIIMESVEFYEHGEADVEDVHPGMTLEAYTSVALDLIQIIFETGKDE